MYKKIFSISLMMFLSTLLFISCSNKDKTGSTTTNGIAKYEGTWDFNDASIFPAPLIIGKDGSCSIDNDKAKEVTKKADNIFNVIFSSTSSGIITEINITITFDTDTTGTVKGSYKATPIEGGTPKEEPINNTIRKQQM